MVRFSRQFVAITAILMFCVGNLAVCVGWQATPEARMACCQDEATCPMHKSGSQDPGSTHTASQAQADNCCAAASNRTQSAVAHTTFVLSNVTALPAAAHVVIPVAVPALQEWRALVPLTVSPVPKHLLLSVLLV